MIKRIACLATLLGDTQGKHYSELVFNAFESARIYNKANNINGAFLIRGNAILQVLEGEPDSLASIMYRINRDALITSANIILNSEITTPVFTRWSIRLLNENAANNKAYTQKLLALMTPDIKILSKIDRHRFNFIFDIGVTKDEMSVHSQHEEKNNTAENPFKNKTLFMKSWPSPTKLRLNAPLMKLSSLLIGHNVNYQRLVELNICATEQELQETLWRLDSVGALNITEVASPHNLAFINKKAPPPQDKKNSHRFSQALKKFIGAQRAKEMQ